MQYVARWRMQRRGGALNDEGVTVGELADRLGYRSEAAFSRAFKRVIGDSPGSVRRRAVEQSSAPITGERQGLSAASLWKRHHQRVAAPRLLATQ